jgi:hypothetical protein
LTINLGKKIVRKTFRPSWRSVKSTPGARPLEVGRDVEVGVHPAVGLQHGLIHPAARLREDETKSWKCSRTLLRLLWSCYPKIFVPSSCTLCVYHCCLRVSPLPSVENKHQGGYLKGITLPRDLRRRGAFGGPHKKKRINTRTESHVFDSLYMRTNQLVR